MSSHRPNAFNSLRMGGMYDLLGYWGPNVWLTFGVLTLCL